MNNTTANGEVAKFIGKVTSWGGRYIFRGQGDNNWKLESGAVRRILQGRGGTDRESAALIKNIATYQRNVLINPAITQAFDLDGHGRVSELELLAKLQHFGAGTALLDFTYDPMVALWFACEEAKEDGTVFALGIDGPDGVPAMEKKEYEKKLVEELFGQNDGERVMLWEPTRRGEAAFRILRQRSVFVIGPPVIPHGRVKEVLIKQERKAEIKKELEAYFGRGGNSLFADIQGFASANKPDTSIGELDDPIWYLNLGDDAYRAKRYQNAVQNYRTAIEMGYDMSHAYIRRGNALTNIKCWDEAVSDFTMVIDNCVQGDASVPIEEKKINTGIAYINRGNVRYALSKFAESIEDYNLGMKLTGTRYAHSILFNRANAQVQIGNFDKALEDYKQCEMNIAKYNQANVLARLGRFKEGQAAYEQYIKNEAVEQNARHGTDNAQKIMKALTVIGERKFDVESEISITKISVHSEGDRSETSQPIAVSLSGDIGNRGNPGPCSHDKRLGDVFIPGGEGFPGGAPITIHIQTKE